MVIRAGQRSVTGVIDDMVCGGAAARGGGPPLSFEEVQGDG